MTPREIAEKLVNDLDNEAWMPTPEGFEEAVTIAEAALIKMREETLEEFSKMAEAHDWGSIPTGLAMAHIDGILEALKAKGEGK